jgi:hypothetical protein
MLSSHEGLDGSNKNQCRQRSKVSLFLTYMLITRYGTQPIFLLLGPNVSVPGNYLTLLHYNLPHSTGYMSEICQAIVSLENSCTLLYQPKTATATVRARKQKNLVLLLHFTGTLDEEIGNHSGDKNGRIGYNDSDNFTSSCCRRQQIKKKQRAMLRNVSA